MTGGLLLGGELGAQPPKIVDEPKAGSGSAEVIPPRNQLGDLNLKATVAQRRAADRWKEVEALKDEVIKHLSDRQRGGGLDFGKEKATVGALRKLTRWLITEYDWQLSRRADWDSTGQAYLEELAKAQQSLEDLGPVWARYSAEESDPKLKEFYDTTAKSVQNLASEMTQRSRDFQNTKSKVSAQFAVMERGRLFLGRFERVLDVLESPLAPAAEVQAQLKELEMAVKQLDVMMNLYKDWSKEKSAPYPGTKPQGTPTPDKSSSQAPVPSQPSIRPAEAVVAVRENSDLQERIEQLAKMQSQILKGWQRTPADVKLVVVMK